MEARAGGAVHRAALECSGVETALIAGVRLQKQPVCSGKRVLAAHRRFQGFARARSHGWLQATVPVLAGKPGVLDALVFGARGRAFLI